ncbi:MAG: ATP-binding protein [Roseburia sp.]|nr:ATP-binding protein [Roseburia sp.]
MFIGREAELKFLNHYYGLSGSQLLIVYGQKGVGKTALLKHFSKDIGYCYYQARACSGREQRYQWGAELQAAQAKLSRYPEYQELFEGALSAQSLSPGRSKKQIGIIDEFQYLVKGDEEFFPELVRFVRNRQKDNPCMIILSTSASGWVENNMLQRIGASASALSGLLKVRELKFQDIMKVFPEYSRENGMLIYAALGGVAGLWQSFSPELSAGENIIRHLIDKYSRLYREISVYMAEELREPAVYNTILAAMAKDCTKLNDIYRHTGFSRAKISVYLKNLMELDLVEKIYSFESEGYANTKKGIYRISNSYVRFYFRYLFPNQSRLRELSPEEFYHCVVEDSYADFTEEAYRRICREQMAESYASVGEWIGKTGNLDIVARDTKGNITICSCSYGRQMTIQDYEWLAYHIRQAKLKPARVILFCEKGFDGGLGQMARESNVILRSILSE